MPAKRATSEQRLRQGIVETGKLLHRAGLVHGPEGNLSCRLGRQRLLCTRSGAPLGFLSRGDLVAVNERGQTQGAGRPTGELPMHLAIYETRPEAGAVLHAHPPYCIALTLAGISLQEPLLPELVAGFGNVPTAPYATPATAEGVAAVRRLILHHDALLLERHGAVAVGADLRDAYLKMEWLEGAAKIIFLAGQWGPAKRLTEKEQEQLREVAARYRRDS